VLARRQAGQDPRVIEIAWRAQRRLNQRWQHLHHDRRSPPGSSRSPSPASSPPSCGRPPSLTDNAGSSRPGRCRGEHEQPGRPTTVARRLASSLWATDLGRQRPLLDGEPRRIPGLEVPALVYESDPAVDRLDLPFVPPRQRPASANHTIKRRSRLTTTSPYE
jgi:hypothetical protein